MDSYCASLKANLHPTKVSRESQRNQGSGFLGERIRGSLKNRDLDDKLLESLKIERKNWKIKPVVNCSVLTSDINMETVVSTNNAQMM